MKTGPVKKIGDLPAYCPNMESIGGMEAAGEFLFHHPPQNRKDVPGRPDQKRVIIEGEILHSKFFMPEGYFLEDFFRCPGLETFGQPMRGTIGAGERTAAAREKADIGRLRV